MKITYSIIAPIYNEIDNLPKLVRRVKEVMDSSDESWELILVDDGSTDGSTERIRELAHGDKTIRPVIFARNFGHQVAITAGWDYARGDAIIIIDGDLQDPPETILELVKKWKEGYEVVYAVRAEREGESWFKKFLRLVLQNCLQHHRCKICGYGDFRLMDPKSWMYSSR